MLLMTSTLVRYTIKLSLLYLCPNCGIAGHVAAATFLPEIGYSRKLVVVFSVLAHLCWSRRSSAEAESILIANFVAGASLIFGCGHICFGGFCGVGDCVDYDF